MPPQRLATVLVTTLAAASIALPAWAHASFDRAQVPAEADVDLTFRAPQERPSNNVSIEALAPGEFTVLSCQAPPNWTCEVDAQSQSPETLVTWTAGPDAVQSESEFPMVVRTPASDKQGVYEWPVVQTTADGHEAAWIGETAPTVQVGDSDASVVENDEVGSHDAPAPPAPSPTPSEPAEPTASTPVASSPTDAAGAPTDLAAPGVTSEEPGRPVGLIVAVIGMAVLGLAAFSVRGRIGR